MKHSRKRFWRAASRIYHCLVSEESPTQLKLPFEDWWHCDRLIRKRQQAQRRGWNLAVLKLERELKTGVGQLIQQLTTLHGKLSSDSPQQQISSVGEIYAELLAIEEDFGEVKWDLRAQSISVITERIELEGIYLGPFEICLDYGNQNTDGSLHYRVIARDPNPAITNDSVTHPHVQSEVVCEGRRAASRYAGHWNRDGCLIFSRWWPACCGLITPTVPMWNYLTGIVSNVPSAPM